MAGGLGFEPRQAESESAVLPLDDPPTGASIRSGREASLIKRRPGVQPYHLSPAAQPAEPA